MPLLDQPEIDDENDPVDSAAPPVPNLALRKQQLRQMVAARQPAAQPQQPTLSALATPQGNAAAWRAEQQGREDAISEQAMTERQAEIGRRRAEIDATKQFNSTETARMRGTGQRFDTDPVNGRVRPIRDTEGRDLYTEAALGPGKDKAGRPALTRRNRYGETETKRPPLRASENPLDTHLLADMGDGQSENYMTLEEGLADPDVQVRRMADVASRRRKVAEDDQEKEALQREIGNTGTALKTATLAKTQAEGELAQISTQINQQMATGMPVDPALTQRQIEIEESMKAGGMIHSAVQIAQADHALTQAKAELTIRDKQMQTLQGRIGTKEERPGDKERLQDVTARRDAMQKGVNEELPKLLKGVGRPVAAEAPAEIGTVEGIVNTGVRAGRQSLATFDVLGASNRARKRDEYAAQADKLEQQAATIDQLQPGWSPENRAQFAERALRSASALRARAGQMAESMGGELVKATEQMQKAGAIKSAPAYEGYQKAEGWDAVKAFLHDPSEISFNIAAEGAIGSIPTLAAGAAGAATGGIPGMVAGTAIGSFSTEYASTLLDTFSEAGVDANDPAALAAAFDNPELMAAAQKRGLARGIPVAVFDALSGGLAGRTVAPAVKGGVKQVLKAGAKEIGEQAAMGMAGETAGQVSEQLTTTGEVDPSKLRIKDIVAEGIGEVVPGAGQIAVGAATRKRGGAAPAPPSAEPLPPGSPPLPGEVPPTDVSPAGPQPGDPLVPGPAPDPATLDRLAKIAEMPPEQAEAEFAKMEAEMNAAAAPAPEAPKSARDSAEVFQSGRSDDGTRSAVDAADAFTQAEIDYKAKPLTTDPVRRANELREELAKLDQEWEQVVARGPQEVDAAIKKQAIDERRAAIATQLDEAENLRQSPQGAEALRADLAAKSEHPAPMEVDWGDAPAAAGTPVAPAPGIAVATPAAAPVESRNMPDWTREEMLRRGLDPARPLNDVDVAQPSVREAVEADPTLTPEQKARTLETGSPDKPTSNPHAIPPESQGDFAAPDEDGWRLHKDGMAYSERVGAWANPADGTFTLDGGKTWHPNESWDAVTKPALEPVPIGPRDATVSTGTGVETAKETQMMAEWRAANAREAAEKAAPQSDPGWRPEYAEDTLSDQSRIARIQGTVEDNPATAIRKMIAEREAAPAMTAETKPAPAVATPEAPAASVETKAETPRTIEGIRAARTQMANAKAPVKITIHNPHFGGTSVIEGSPLKISIIPEADFVAAQQGGLWRVYEKGTGLKVGKGTTKAKAIEDAKAMIGSVGVEKTRKAISDTDKLNPVEATPAPPTRTLESIKAERARMAGERPVATEAEKEQLRAIVKARDSWKRKGDGPIYPPLEATGVTKQQFAALKKKGFVEDRGFGADVTMSGKVEVDAELRKSLESIGREPRTEGKRGQDEASVADNINGVRALLREEKAATDSATKTNAWVSGIPGPDKFAAREVVRGDFEKLQQDIDAGRRTLEVTNGLIKGAEEAGLIDAFQAKRLRSKLTTPETPSIAAQLPAVSTPEVVTGDPLNKSWTAFGPESQSLGVPRAEMPQIKSEARGALVNFLKARGIDAKAGMIAPGKLKPTQAEFSPAKVQAAREHTGSERPILISADGHVIDGHHQWMAALDDTTTPMPVIRLNAPVDKLIAEMREFPSAEAAKGAPPAAKAPPPAPKATIPLSDRAIAALQKAKLHKPGQLSAATPFSLAYDGAIELAILGIRAGRVVADVVKLAIQRFKAMHPKHTAEELGRVESAVRQAIENRPPEPEPGKNKSKVPPSLREVGVPAEDIEYDVRAQNERMAEARTLIAKDGDAKAEASIANRSLPADTRVALGGVLLEKKMEALKAATPEQAPALVRDIQRITAATRAGVSTESGQGVAMHNKIYENLAVGSAMEYVRHVDRQRLEKMGGEDTSKAMDEAAKALNKVKTQAERDAAIDKLKEKYTTAPTRRALDQLKRMEVAKELNALGVLTRDDLVDVAGNALGIPGIEQAKLKHIAELADRIQKAKNHAERSRAELELADTLSIYKGVRPLDLEASILTLNILSGPTTQGANIEGNALQMLSNLGTTALVNPTKVGPLAKGFMDGIGLGMTQAKSILATGRSTRDFQDKTGGGMSHLANIDYARDFPATGKVAGAVLTGRARIVDKIGRFMKAADAVFYYPAREAYARLVATKLLEGEYSGAELEKRVREQLHVTPEAFESARRQAVAEGYEGIDLGRRVSDIIEERRAQTATGKEVVKQSERFAAETTYTNEPVGLAGVIYRNLATTVRDADIGGVPVLKPWAMFLRTPANVFNATTNFTPLGATRAKFGMKGEKYRKGGSGEGQWRNFSRDERNRLYVQSIIGTTLMAGLVARALKGDDDDITASGPADGSKRAQLKQGGWIPFSIKVGDKRVSYKDSPLLVPLAIVGHVADAVKYQKSKSDLVLESKIADAAAQAPQIIFQTSMLSGMADLMSSLSNRGGGAEAVGRTLGSIPANLVIPYNRLLQQVDQTFDNQTYDNPPVVGGVPFLRRTGTPNTDVQGRPQTYSPANRFASTESRDPVDALLRAKNVFIPDVGKDIKIGNRVMTDPERDRYRQMSGQRIRIRLTALAPMLRVMSQEEVQKRIESVAREERERMKPYAALPAKLAPAR